MKISLIIFLVIISDILSKWWTNTHNPSISILGEWIKIIPIKNTGIAFSTPLPGIHILIPLILLGLFVFIIYSWRSLPEKEKIGYTLIFTGWLLNAIERSIFGSVTDMVSVQYFAIFNIADIAVTCGVWLLLITSILYKKEEPLKSCK